MPELKPGTEIEQTQEELKEMIAGIIEKLHWIEGTLVKIDLKRIRINVLIDQLHKNWRG